LYEKCSADCQPLPVPLAAADELWKDTFSALQIQSEDTIEAFESLLKHLSQWQETFQSQPVKPSTQ